MLSSIVAEDARRIAAADLPWERFSGKRVLVTGAAGALATYIVEALLTVSPRLDRPISVAGLVRNEARARARFSNHGHNPDLELVIGDVTTPNPDWRYDYIIHAASNATPKYYSSDPVGTISANLQGTQNLLETARVSGSEGLLYVSSGEVYGEVSKVPTAEGDYGYLDPTALRACYAESKRAGENLCVAYNHQHGVPTFIVRPFHTYGPTMALDDGRVFADFVADIVANRNIVIKGDGLARRAFCYVSDATTGFLTVVLKGEQSIPYNVGNEGGEASIGSLAQMLVGLFPDRGLDVEFGKRDPGGAYMVSPITRSCPDTSRIRALGWQPTVGLQDGFRRTVLAMS
ncbi:MAG: NAD-dependent epimerase/dehydratase family protein [Alphaproteobacteria bacterium]|nr:NAD-dependent epimerase/dehydratase family protein [Alphaproteobacteria bacterium]MBU2270015.1 NAD-dependent epimerase/dehydratase family protein [Alphaproteobacteria bacterium]MBU2417858.1 NAD-dependent epimerase/dehydratase family protein [Alphaproteobacteria bacterium]